MPRVPPLPRQYSHGHLDLPHRPWGQEVLLVLGSLCHPGANEMAPSASCKPLPLPPHCSWGQPGPGDQHRHPLAVQPPSPASDRARGYRCSTGGTARAGLPSLLQHQPHWEPGGQAEVRAPDAAQGSLSLSWGRQSWTGWAASLTGLPGGPGSPYREMGVIVCPFPSSTLPPHQHSFLPSPSPPGGRLVLELPAVREETSRGWQCQGTHTRAWQPQEHSTTTSAPTHLSARWPWPPRGSHFTLSEGRKRKQSGPSSHPLPGQLLQGRAGITPTWPQPPQSTYLLALGAWHATVTLQNEAERGVRSLPPSPPHCTSSCAALEPFEAQP